MTAATEALVVSVTDAAVMLCISERLVYKLIAEGDLPVVNLGTRRLIPRRAIDMVIDRSMARFDPDRVLSAIGRAS